jgi:hypothetical protein
MNIAKIKPIILDILILKVIPNVSFIILKSSSIGDVKPNDSPYPIQDKNSTFEAKSPNNPPTTNPDNININKIHIFFSFIAIFLVPLYFT